LAQALRRWRGSYLPDFRGAGRYTAAKLTASAISAPAAPKRIAITATNSQPSSACPAACRSRGKCSEESEQDDYGRPHSTRVQERRRLPEIDHSDTLADHLRNAARAAQMRSRRGHVECLRVADSLFALTQSQYFPGLAKRRSSAGFLRQRARLERLNPCAASTCVRACVRAARTREELRCG
jgi:hypothetical protein